MRVHARPIAWPFVGDVPSDRMGLLCIDFQFDFCHEGGMTHATGADLTDNRRAIGPAHAVLAAARAAGWLIVHTRVGHRPELSDVPPSRLVRRVGAKIAPGMPGPMGRYLTRGEPGWEIIPEMAPERGEVVIDKTGKGAFYATELELVLRNHGITHLAFVGVTLELCVQTTLREAADRGFECLLVDDAVGTLYSQLRAPLIESLQVGNGLIATVATSSELLAAFGAPVDDCMSRT